MINNENRDLFDHFYALMILGNFKERSLEKLAKNLERNKIDDIHKYMSWWSCFDEMD